MKTNYVDRVKSYLGVEIWIRGDESYVRSEVTRLLENMSLVHGYGLCVQVKPKLDPSRGDWVAKAWHANSCD
jgi:hypothetical protein